MKTAYTSEDGHNGEVLAFLPLLQEEIYTWRILDLGDEPLSQRAWALQERALANRTLIYGTYQVYFECGVQFMSENGLYVVSLLAFSFSDFVYFGFKVFG